MKVPQLATVSVARDEGDLRALYARCLSFTRATSAGIYHPDDSTMTCNDCTFKQACRALFRGENFEVYLPSKAPIAPTAHKGAA
jgi:hypothetical protein